MTITRLLIFLMFFLASPAWADSILDIPQGTTFVLQQELEILPNRNFAILGQNDIDEAFNSTGQFLNDQDSRPLGNGRAGSYNNRCLTFRNYYTRLFESYEETYVKCLERHRHYVRTPGSSSGNNVIIQNGRNNVAVINQGAGTSDQVDSYIGENYCTAPNHTIAALVIDRDKAEGGGFFAEGYKFKVKKVKQRRRGFYNVTEIHFDHTVLAGIIIVSTHQPEEIPIGALDAQEHSTGKGFWASVGQALTSLTNIGGGYFQIELPEKRYYD
jgi:hypothetical protein